MRLFVRLAFLICGCFTTFDSTSAFAKVVESKSNEVKLKTFDDLAVFPIDHTPTDDATQKALDDAWWDLRENLTADKRFTVATKMLLTSREAFQPRQELTVNEAVFLAQAVNAKALVTLSSRNQSFHLRVYWAETGTLLWSSDTKLNVMKLEKDQIRDVVVGAGADFLKHVPYDGHQMGEVVRSNQITARILKRVVLASEGSLREGEVVEWIDVVQPKAGQSFLDHPTIRVNARGTISKMSGDNADVKVEALDNLSYLRDSSLIRFPRLAKKFDDETVPIVDARALAKNGEPKDASNVFLAAIFHIIAIALLAF